MKVVILAGGRGTRLSEETHAIPKPMVFIGDRPILWHIMNHYSQFGFDDFVVALGYKGYVIKEYFANYRIHGSDLSVNLRTGEAEYHNEPDQRWRVTLIDTGLDTMTGGRVKRLSHLLTERFLLTYGDGLSDVPVDKTVAFHESKDALATVTAVRPPARFGALSIVDGIVNDFLEKPLVSTDRINGGYFVMEPEVLELVADDDMVLEREPMTALARLGRLAAYDHDGFWMPMDTLRERDELVRLWETGHAPWIVR